jgi:hypothetical protein
MREIVAAGERATEEAIPAIRRALELSGRPSGD